MSPPPTPMNIYQFHASHLYKKEPNAIAVILAWNEKEAREILVREGYDETQYHLGRWDVEKADFPKFILWTE